MLNQLVNFDKNLFTSFNSILGLNPVLDWLLEITTVYLVYLVPLGLLFGWFYYRDVKIKKMLLGATVAGIFAWQVITHTLGKLIDRPRPIAEVAGAKEVLFHVPSYSFPSDHTTLLACLATYFCLAGYKKLGIWSWILTLVIVVSRIIGGMHYPGDILAGALVGSSVAYIFWLLDKPYKKYIVDPLYRVAQFIYLAPKNTK